MKSFNFFLLFIAFAFTNSCRNSDHDIVENNNIASKYPIQIDSLGLEKEYDNAKWALYLLQCDDTAKTNRDSFLFPNNPMPFCSMELILDSLSLRGDTSDLYFVYKDNKGNYISNCIDEPLNKDLIAGKRYINENDSTIWWLYRCTNMSDSWIGPADPKKFESVTDREIKQLQPDVIAFLNKNKSVLHPWLYKEAVKRGVIKDSL